MCWCLFIATVSIHSSKPFLKLADHSTLQFSGWAVFLKNNWNTATFVTNYLPLALFPALYISSRLYFRESIKKPEEMDFVSGLAEIEADTYVPTDLYLPMHHHLMLAGSTDEPPPRNKVEAFWQWLVRISRLRTVRRG